MNLQWKLSNDLLGKMCSRRMAEGKTIQHPRVVPEENAGVGLVTFKGGPQGLGDPDCIVDLERKADAEETL